MPDQKLISEAAAVVSKAQVLVVSTGAGISKESGIPTFREAQTGLWSRYDPEQLATPQAFLRNRDLVWSWYMYRLDLVRQAQPNPGHLALVRLEDLVPQMVILTQNVDGLHVRAGSTDVVELHGNISRFKCFAACRGKPTLVDLDPASYSKEIAPPCPYCNSYLRPDVVWFTENLPTAALSRAFRVAEHCDVMMVVGTSGIVQPAASLPVVAKQRGAILIEVNPRVSGLSGLADIFLQGPAGEVLPALVDALHPA
nr:NAD-dependent deacylase [Anaerolineae bacterium]